MNGNANNDEVEVLAEEEILSSESTTTESENIPSKKTSKVAIVIALLSLILTILVILAAIYFYKQNTQLVANQQATIAQLSNEFNSQKSSFSAQSQKTLSLQSEVEQTNLQLQDLNNTSKISQTDIQSLQRALAANKARHPNDWILSEVEYLVNLAGRKIWLEKDVPSAISLLHAADQRIIELNDASLSDLRRAFLEDINTLGALPNRDPDGMVLTLSELERRIDKLAIIGAELSDKNPESTGQLSDDVKDWKQNLESSWSDFMGSFIVINKRDSKIEALLSPEQRWYLKENVRHNLGKAELAVYREQQTVYDQALQEVINMLDNYYNLNDSATDYFYKSVKELSKRKISVKYPDQLKSEPILERIIDLRIKTSLATPSVKQG
ncbi:uroporphyrinogen-III C-methyltransferase [Psychromonas sp. PT13]|uniref:uroporphyrinogen-III C-methyltransferase n=1 Tax=Psychromonas sp. PT13 TaxID=3439547 RepID=UPI003EB7527B